jgi:hypothetical protein
MFSRGGLAAIMHDNILNQKFDLTTTRQWALNDTRLNEWCLGGILLKRLSTRNQSIKPEDTKKWRN